jgi:lipid-binding SYLF domain-containing protein
MGWWSETSQNVKDWWSSATAAPGSVRILAQKKVTPEITAWSKSLVMNPTDYPMGIIVHRRFGDLLVRARLEHHTWSHDKAGKLIQGNFRGVTLYEITT